jgi:hypothetical protein
MIVGVAERLENRHGRTSIDRVAPARLPRSPCRHPAATLREESFFGFVGRAQLRFTACHQHRTSGGALEKRSARSRSTTPAPIRPVAIHAR